MSVIRILTFCVIQIFFVNEINSFPNKSPIVCVPNLEGCVEGIQMRGISNDNSNGDGGNNDINYFDAFLGIPYAKPPVGDLRLSNPIPTGHWNGTIQAKNAKSDCAQKNYLLPVPIVSGDEDCLYLNIYRPSTEMRQSTTDDLLPVMVYIYGGGYFSGSANPLIHGPEYIMSTNEMILVTIAYRLGALGFLSTGDDTMPGNFGLKDQVLALKWIQNNIQEFGGNPLSVTIFGQSAGGASVHMHMFSPLSRGLFHRAIVMSGNAAAPYNDVIKNPLQQARKQASFCGIQNVDQLTNEELLRSLREIDVHKFITAGDGFKYWHVDPLTTFRPVIEINKTNGFLIDEPINYVKNGNFMHIPWMIGCVPFEGAVRALSITTNQTLLNDFNANFDILLEKLMEFQTQRNNNDNFKKINKIVDYYLNGSHQLTMDNAQRFGDIISDRAFLHPLYKTVNNYVRYANLENNPIYLYKFSYKGPYSYSFLYTGNLNDYGVVHCDDLIYLFRSPLIFPIDFNKNSIDFKVVKAFVETFVTFAKTGEPKKWSTIRQCNRHLLDNNQFCDYEEFINLKNSTDNFSIITNNDYDMETMKFWDEILEN